MAYVNFVMTNKKPANRLCMHCQLPYITASLFRNLEILCDEIHCCVDCLEKFAKAYRDLLSHKKQRRKILPRRRQMIF